jgi:hypothetical protein
LTGANDAEGRAQATQQDHGAAALALDLLDFSAQLIDTVALDLDQLGHARLVDLGRRDIDLVVHLIRFLHLAGVLEPDRLRASAGVALAHVHHVGKGLLFLRRRQQRLDLLHVERGLLVGFLAVGGKHLDQRGIAALDDGGGTLHGQGDIAAPVADQAVLLDRLVEHLLGRIGDCVQLENADNGGEDRQQQDNGEAKRKALADLYVRQEVHGSLPGVICKQNSSHTN